MRMRRILARCIVALCATLSIATSVSAKEPTRKLIISGGRLAGSVEIVDPGTLALSDLFAGNFLDTTRHAAPDPHSLTQYEVSFYLSDDRGNALQRFFARPRLYRAYVVRLALDSAQHTAYVYLPGRGDVWSAWNRGLIVRSQQEGHWNYASDAWARRITDAIAHARLRPAPSCPPANAVFHPGDSLYRAASELTNLLDGRGLRVLCANQSTLDGMLGRPGVGIVTNLGPFAVLFFPSSSDARAVRVTGSVKNGQAMTVLRAPNGSHPVDSLYDAEPQSFIIHGRWLIDTFGQHELEMAVRSALGER